MITPNVNQVLKMSNEYNLIPVVKRILADMETPIRIFRRYAENERAFLLESVEGGIQWARYSFIGTDPFLMISAKRAGWKWKKLARSASCQANLLKN